MLHSKLWNVWAALAIFLAGFALVLAMPSVAHADEAQPMYRLYNPNSGEHFYTASTNERDSVDSAGWNYEGVGWVAPTSGTPVYRLYNSIGGEHHYTTSPSERQMLIKAGWTDEGVRWYSDDAQAVPLYRQYNPNQFTCNHNYSTSAKEDTYLKSIGWRGEGIGWYGIAEGYAVSEADKAKWVGKWELYDMTSGENSMSADEVNLMRSYGYEAFVTFYEDGNGSFMLYGDYTGFTWAAKDAAKGSLIIDGGEASMSISGGSLTIWDNSASVRFTR